MPQAHEIGSILIVDDNPINIDVLEGLLSRRGHRILTAEDGDTGIAIVLEELPDVLLLDINMPDMSGYEVCERLKSMPITQNIPIIFVSALGATEDLVRGFDAGAVDYITKPFNAKEVVARVETHILMSHQHKQINMIYKRETQQQAMIDAMRQQFISSATHDLKSPLAIISGYTEILAVLPELVQDEGAQEYIQAIRRGITKMNAVISDMLDLIRLETVIALKTEDVDIVQFVQEAATDMKIRASEKNIQFDISVPDTSHILQIDRVQMARVLDNLMSNAIKYTTENGAVYIGAEITDEDVVITVKDTGLGIPEEQLGTIFLPFQRIQNKAHMQQEGTGLGLSIVKSIVEQHKGQISVTSELGKGSTFLVRLPK